MGRSALTEPTAVALAASQVPIDATAASPRAELFRFASACVIGAGVALSGFPPLNNIAGVLHPERAPALVLLTPPMLLAACALLASRLAPAHDRNSIPPLAIAAVSGLVIGAGLSLLQSDRPDVSLSIALDDIVAPALVFFGLRRSSLSLEVTAGAFLTALTCRAPARRRRVL